MIRGDCWHAWCILVEHYELEVTTMTHSTYLHLQVLSVADPSLTVNCGTTPLHVHLAQFSTAKCEKCAKGYMRHLKDEGYLCDVCESGNMHRDY